MRLHGPSLALLMAVGMRRLAHLAAFTAREVQHARELIGRVQQFAVAVVLMHHASFQG